MRTKKGFTIVERAITAVSEFASIVTKLSYLNLFLTQNDCSTDLLTLLTND